MAPGLIREAALPATWLDAASTEPLPSLCRSPSCYCFLPQVQFQAVALMHALRANDRLAVSKLVTQLTRGNVRSPMAQVLLVRYVAQVMAESQPGAGGEARPFYDFLESCLRHKSELVIFEAARAICNMREVTSRELAPAVTVLQLFLSSSKPVLRFAAVRTLNKVGGGWPRLKRGSDL